MRFAVLGGVLVDGRPPRGAIERALPARLLVAPGVPLSAAELIEAAWPQERRAGAAGSLRVRMAGLRALLEPERGRGEPAEVLVREPAGYRLVVAPDSVDAERFARLADEAARLPAPAALDRCEEALALWRGEPFADLDLVEAAAAEARRLHGVRDRLRHTRALALLDTGRAEDAARDLATLVAEDPLREALVRDLMLARYRAGRHAEALDAYRELARRLAELGLTPGPQVRELEALVLRHADELARPASAPLRVAHPSLAGRPRGGVPLRARPPRRRRGARAVGRPRGAPSPARHGCARRRAPRSGARARGRDAREATRSAVVAHPRCCCAGALGHARAALEHARSGRVPAGVSAARAAVQQLEARPAVAPR